MQEAREPTPLRSPRPARRQTRVSPFCIGVEGLQASGCRLQGRRSSAAINPCRAGSSSEQRESSAPWSAVARMPSLLDKPSRYDDRHRVPEHLPFRVPCVFDDHAPSGQPAACSLEPGVVNKTAKPESESRWVARYLNRPDRRTGRREAQPNCSRAHLHRHARRRLDSHHELERLRPLCGDRHVEPREPVAFVETRSLVR